MIEVNTVDLNEHGVRFPADRLAVVFSQPFLKLTDQEPFVTRPEAREQQLANIARTLEVAKSRPHQLDRTHITVFPEYSIPGLLGFEALLQGLSHDTWPNATIVVAGIDGLTSAQYKQLCEMQGANYSSANAPSAVTEHEWVNCGLTIVKNASGQLHFWTQPKISPAWEEQDTRVDRMFRGRAINLFKGKLTNDVYFRLVSVICFDWIANVGKQGPMDWVIENLDGAAGEAQLPLTWALVIQHNPKPSHQAFLGRIAPFFDQQRFPRTLRDRASLLFCNSAGHEKPARTSAYGGSSLIHSKRDLFKLSHNSPTVSSGGARFRDGSEALSAFHDTYFREGGACVHAFTLNNSLVLPAGPQGRSFAVEDARVFSFGDPCPRAPNGPVPASVKWTNDALDNVASVGDDFSEAPLAAIAKQAHERALAYLRTLDGRAALRLVRIASGAEKGKDGDDWDRAQENALQHVTKTLDILATASSSHPVANSEMHGAVDLDGVIFDVLALSGRRHEECLDRVRWEQGGYQRPLLVVSRDEHNTPLDSRGGSFIDTPHAGESRFTFPSDHLRLVGFQNLLSAFRQASDQPELKLLVKGLLR